MTHPLVEDTHHIDRQALRVVIDAPALPAWLRRALEADLGPPISLAFALIGFAAFWPARRTLLLGVELLRSLGEEVLRSFRGLEVAVAVALLAVGFAFFHDNGLSADEDLHYGQIVRVSGDNWSLHPRVAMLPGFHVLVATLARAIGGTSEFSIRLIVFMLSLATVGVFHALAKTLQSETAGARTLQFTLLPILFPQFFFIYTDVTSLLFVLLMMLAAARGHLRSAGALGLLSCLVRQNNVIWVAFAMLWSYLRQHGWTWRPFRESLARYWTFIATGVGFLLFVVMNGGQVALGVQAGDHPLGSLHFTNVFFLLFLSAFLFLPLWWGYGREVWARRTQWWPWLSVLGLFSLFWFGFVNDHPFNESAYFLRNVILVYFSSTTALKLLFFAPVAVAALCLTAVPMRKPWWLLFPFTILVLLPEWLVEQRYYLIPLSLFLLAREHTAPWSERLQTTLFAVGSAWLFLVVERGWAWL